MRLLVWLALAFLVILALRKKGRGKPEADPVQAAPAPPPVGRPTAGAEDMVCCAHCHIYLPASEAVFRHQETYCSSAHAELH